MCIWLAPPCCASDGPSYAVQNINVPLGGDAAAVQKYADEVEALKKKVKSLALSLAMPLCATIADHNALADSNQHVSQQAAAQSDDLMQICLSLGCRCPLLASGHCRIQIEAHSPS